MIRDLRKRIEAMRNRLPVDYPRIFLLNADETLERRKDEPDDHYDYRVARYEAMRDAGYPCLVIIAADMDD